MPCDAYFLMILLIFSDALKDIEINNQYIRNQKITKKISPNTFGIAIKAISEKTGIPAESGIISGATSVMSKKRPCFISMVYGIEVLSIVGGIEFA